MEQLVILIIIGLISFVNWLLQRAAKARALRDQELHGDRRQAQQKVELPFDVADEEVPVQRGEPSADETRRFLEALGLPTHEVRPSELTEKASPPPLPVKPRPIERTTVKMGELAPKIDDKARRLADKFRSAEQEEDSVKSDTSPSNFHTLLRSANGLKHAIILREVLNPPKGF